MSLLSRPIKRSQTIEVQVDNQSASEFKFADNLTTLDGVKVTGVSIGTASITKTKTGRIIVPDATQKKAVLTLVDKGGKKLIDSLPMDLFYRTDDSIIELDRLELDIRNSSINLDDKSGLVGGTDYSFLVTFFFEV